MGCRLESTWLAVGAALFAGQTAQAADSVYLGDCARAKIIQQQSTVDTLIPHTRYEGVQRLSNAALNTDDCPMDQIVIDTLSQKSRSTKSVIFDTRRLDINFGKAPGCPSPVLLEEAVVGTVTFTTILEKNGDLCDLYIWADWTQALSSDPLWKGNFASRIISMDGGSFALTQPESVGGQYQTPAAYTGVNK
jgi:hypothetical protein